MIVPFVATAVAQSKLWYDADKLGASRLAIGNAIRLMCRAARAARAITSLRRSGCANMLEGYAPTIPDWANDKHTIAARSWGAASITSAAKARSWCRRRQSRTRTRPKPIGCGRSSSRASKPNHAASHWRLIANVWHDFARNSERPRDTSAANDSEFTPASRTAVRWEIQLQGHETISNRLNAHDTLLSSANPWF